MLSKKAKYALKALEYIAKQSDISPILISEISEAQNIPKKFLETILLELKRAGILKSKKGKFGGYNLQQSADKINLGFVIRLIDGPISLIACVSDKYYEPCAECENEATCGLRSVVKEVREATTAILTNVTLADLIKREQRLKKSKRKIK